jgi:hypothetical protein
MEGIEWLAREDECSDEEEYDHDQEQFERLCAAGVSFCVWMRWLGKRRFDGLAWVRAALLLGTGEDAECVQERPQLAFALADAIDFDLR